MAATILERELRDETTALLRDLIRVDTTNPPGRETAAATLRAHVHNCVEHALATAALR